MDTPQKEIYQLGQIELKPLSFLNLKITKTSSEDHQLNWRLQYFITQCRYTFDFTSLEPNSLYCFEARSYDFTQNAAEPDFSKRFKTLRDVSVKFLYKIDDGNEQTIEIPMNEKTVDYEFTY
ncbi:hypothetical protein [Mesonia maritima]|uniref:Fibronectin type-III domain-containing protein n=1 Tax=Mesonia maritima TaxID=1793873 RepID=A0ABU1K6F7_9FLAO|nr:hypothetical protein [Mesonia maritima]MDR6301193.1 hypothetical protein [Mesonia maritima]